MRPTITRAKRRSKPRATDLADVAATAFSTELGWMAVAFRDETLVGIVFGHGSPRNATEALHRAVGCEGAILDLLATDDCPPAVRHTVDKLQRFSAGERVDFDGVAIDQSHLTPFGRSVVAACRKIAPGATRSYGELAAACGSPGAARAVGHVMATNRYPIVVPCHRVVGANGTLGGFSAPHGLSMKKRMLSLESEPNLQTPRSHVRPR